MEDKENVKSFPRDKIKKISLVLIMVLTSLAVVGGISTGVLYGAGVLKGLSLNNSVGS